MLSVSRRRKCGIVVSGTQTTLTMATTVIDNRRLAVLAALAVVWIGCAPSASAAFGVNETASTATATITTASAMADSHASDAMANATAVTLSHTGNVLWDGLVNECMASPTVACFQKNVYHYLDDTLRPGDVNVTNGFRFVRNRLDATVLRTYDSDVDGNSESGGPVAEEAEEDDQGRAAGEV